MKVTLQKQESNQVCLEVEVEARQVSDTFEKKFREASQRVNIPGFRKGKAPRKILEKFIHVDMLKQDVVEQLVSDSYSEALKNLDNPIEPITEPKIELVKFDLNEPLVFKAILEVRPEVTLGQYKDFDFKVDALPLITDKDVEAELEALAKRHGELVQVEDRAVKEDDVVTVDIQGEMEGEPIPEGTTDNLAMEVKPGNFVPGFSEQLVGMNKDEEKEVKVTFPDDYPVVDLRGKEGTFKVKLKEIKELKVPELNDDFARHLGEHDLHRKIENLDDVRARIREELEQNRESAKVIKTQQALIEKIVSGSEVEVPKSMLQRELFAMWSNGEGKTLSDKGVNKEVLQASWENWNSREDLASEASKRIKTTLVLGEIAKQEQITVTNEELNSEIESFASVYNVSTDELRNQLIKNNRMIPLVDELLSLKIINWLESNSSVSYAEEETTSSEENKADVEEKPKKKTTKASKTKAAAEEVAEEPKKEEESSEG